MELSLALDPGAGAAVAAPGPGTDANDPAAEAFAALLASLVATTAPPPTPVPVAVPAATVASATADEAPAATVLPVVLALPAAVPTVAGADEGAEPAPPTVTVPAFSSPSPPQRGGERDQNADADLERPVTRPMPTGTATATATVTAEAVVPPVAQAFSSPSPPQRGGERDQKPETASAPVVAATPAAPQVLKPEIVKGPVAPPPPPPATPVEQVVRAVAPLRQLADGTHSILLELRPADLGVVRVELSLAGGVVHLGLQADTEGTSQLLRAALPELRAQLDNAGLVAGRLDVDDGSAGQRGDREPSWRSDADTRPGTAAPDVVADDLAPTASSSSAHGQIDVLL